MDPHHPGADPDADPNSDFYLMQIRILILFDADAEPDPTFHPNAHQDTVPSFKIKAQTLEKVAKSAQIGSYFIHFSLLSEN